MIIAAMATMPERMSYLEKVVMSIRPQVDALRVYLNNFNSIPPFLLDDECCLSSEALGDLGDSGKFYWLDGKGGLSYSHYLTVDDDLGYPSNYVSTLVEEFDARDGRAIVGVHGSTFSQPIEDFVTSRDERFRFYEGLHEARSVHILGTATVILGRQTIDLSLSDFKVRNAADLQLAIKAQDQEVPMVAVARAENWITEERPWTADGYSIWKSTKQEGAATAQTRLANEAVERWRLHEDPLRIRATEITSRNDKRGLFAQERIFGTFDDCVEVLSAKLRGSLFFVVVGAMDGIGHDNLRKHIVGNPDWSGLFVEPLQDMMASLKENYAGRDNVSFEMAAITETDGVATICRIPVKKVGRDCPPWADGISTLKPNLHIIGRREDLKIHSVNEAVRTTTFRDIVARHRISRVDIVQIDAEGYDKHIFDQVWLANFRPALLRIEVNYLTYVEINELRDLLETHRYYCFFERHDLIATKL